MRKWDDEWSYYLLTVPAKHWRIIWPENTQDALHTRKKKLKRDIEGGSRTMPEKPKDLDPERTPEELHDKLHEKLGELSTGFGDILRLHNMSPEMAEEFTQQGFHVGYIKNANNEIEYTIPLPSAKSGRANLEDFTPAQPAKIEFTRRKPEKRDHKVLFVFSDAQIDYRRLNDGSLEPIHDERALRVATLMCKDLMPDEIINTGDTVDLSALSKFKLDSDHFHRTLGPSFQRAHDLYAQLRADSPWAKIVEVDSNHNTRLKDFMLRNAPTLYGMKQAGAEDLDYPVLSYPFLANLKHIGVEWVSGYGAAEYVYGAEYDKPPIIFKHGNSAVSNGSTAAKESKENPEVHVVRGHTHRMETFYRTTRAGNYLASVIVGSMCRITGEVPSYHSAVDDHGHVVKTQENWQQSVLVIEDYDGDYHFNHVPIVNGVANFRGKEYRYE